MITKYDNEMMLEFISKSCNEAFARISVSAGTTEAITAQSMVCFVSPMSICEWIP